MSDYITVFSAIAFSILLSSDLIVGHDPEPYAQHPKLIRASRWIFWTCILGFLVLPIGALRIALGSTVHGLERGLTGAVFVLSVVVVYWLCRIKAMQTAAQKDQLVLYNIRRDVPPKSNAWDDPSNYFFVA